MSYCLSRNERLSKSSQFLHVRQLGISVKTSSFWLQLSKSDVPKTRLGIIATKRIGNAVCRNRAKRITRELYRTQKNSLPKYLSIVVIPRKSILTMPYQDLVTFFRDAILKASIKI